jgi:hypothetical protein
MLVGPSRSSTTNLHEDTYHLYDGLCSRSLGLAVCGTACTHVSPASAVLLLVPQVNVAVPGVTNVAVNGDKVAVVAPGTTVAASSTGAVGEAALACLHCSCGTDQAMDSQPVPTVHDLAAASVWQLFRRVPAALAHQWHGCCQTLSRLQLWLSVC